MDGRLLFKDCAVLREGRLVRGSAVVVEGPRVVTVGEDAAVPGLPGDWVVEARGRLLAPGRMDCHAHLTGARGAAGSRRGRTDAEVEALTAWSLAEALRAGVTTVCEHLSDVERPRSALEVQGRCARALGIRLLSAYAGADAPAVGAALVEASRDDALVRGALSVEDWALQSDAELAALARLREGLAAPLLLHLAESDAELIHNHERHGMRSVERLDGHGLLGRTTIAAHARNLDGGEARVLGERGVVVAWSPLADLLGDGRGFDAVWAPEHRVGLGSAGVGSVPQQWEAARIAAHRTARLGRLWPEELLEPLIQGPAGLLREIWGEDGGVVRAGAVADLALFDLVPGEDLEAAELRAGLGAARVAWTVVAGRVVVRDGQLLGTDAIALARDAAGVRRAGA